MPEIYLKPSREASLLRHHPWIFSGAIEKVAGEPQAGETIEIFSSKKVWLARGAFSPQSQIRARVWTFDENEKVHADFFGKKIRKAVKLRNEIFQNEKTLRLVYGESDGLPGLIVDRYENYLVTQFLSAGAEFWRNEIAACLRELIPCDGIYDRSDAAVREKEGLQPHTGLLSGKEPPSLIEATENGCRFLVDVRGGHKTGFYLDQRESRKALAEYVSGKTVLNCFSYTGAFSVVALRAEAVSVTNIDTSAEALKLAEQNVKRNGLDASMLENVEGDVFALLRKFRNEQRQFDVVILDPPKFVESVKHLDKAARGYKDINMLAFQNLKPGGLLFTFSCSGLLDASLFQKIVADAALDAGKEAVIIERLSQSADHPVALNFPEAAYLKGLVCKIS